MAFQVLHTEKIYRGRAVQLRVDTIRLPNGRETKLEIIDHTGSVVLVPQAEDGRIWFVRQYRHAAGKQLLELPAGTIEPGELPERCAARELREEIGMAADELREIGSFFLAPGYTTEYMHVFLARRLRSDPLLGDEDEILQPEAFSQSEARNMFARGEIEDAKTIAALALSWIEH
jgi:ADP-ribose pyrophosphatase